MRGSLTVVMAGFMPAIHVFLREKRISLVRTFVIAANWCNGTPF
jgi:hypothetical protein